LRGGHEAGGSGGADGVEGELHVGRGGPHLKRGEEEKIDGVFHDAVNREEGFQRGKFNVAGNRLGGNAWGGSGGGGTGRRGGEVFVQRLRTGKKERRGGGEGGKGRK